MRLHKPDLSTLRPYRAPRKRWKRKIEFRLPQIDNGAVSFIHGARRVNAFVIGWSVKHRVVANPPGCALISGGGYPPVCTTKQAGRGAFLDELHRAVGQIGRNPGMVLRRSPFVIVFREVTAGVEIIAVAHGHTRPGYWRYRDRCFPKGNAPGKRAIV